MISGVIVGYDPGGDNIGMNLAIRATKTAREALHQSPGSNFIPAYPE